jgi:hypothetical protein
MTDPGPLDGDDITADLRHPDMLGVGLGCSADAAPTIELTTDPAVHGPHGLVQVRRGAPTERRLLARIERPGTVRATCQSDDSIRIWGRFAPEVDLVVHATEAVRLVVRTPGGSVLAGPLLLAVDGPPTTLQW